MIKNKKGLLNIGKAIFVLIAIALFFILVTPQETSAGKTDQYYSENYTCENFTDSVLWTVLSSKSKFNNIYLNWTPGNSCPGVKNCDMVSIFSYIRYSSVGTQNMPVGGDLAQIANTSQSPMPTNNGGDNVAAPAEWGSARYVGYQNNTILSGDVVGPRYECGNETPGQKNNTCNTAEKGYNESYFNYSVRLQGGSTTANTRMLLDNFEVKYPWCWTPIIYDANVSRGTGGWGNLFNFTIKVTDPNANATVRLWKRSVGTSEWYQIGTNQSCSKCANTTLSFPIYFTCGEIGDWEFKFNATDNQSFSTEAGASSTTNQCLDSGNDCVLSVEKDNVNISYVSGNASSASLTSPAWFNLSVYDLTKNNNNISEPLYIKFDVSNQSFSEPPFRTMGYNQTNASGNVIFSFLPDTGFTSGLKTWYGYVDTGQSTCYNYNLSNNYTVSVSVDYNAPPNYQNQTVNGNASGAVGGWGEVWNFSVSVSDPTGDNLNVSLEIDAAGSGFQEIAKKPCYTCSSLTQFNFSVNFSCSDIDSSADYRFVIYDNSSNTNTTTSYSFNIDKDDVIFEHIIGNNTITNRSGTQSNFLSLKIYDTDNETYLISGENITFSVMRDSITWGTGITNITNSSGATNFTFDPTCNPRYEVGDRSWKAELSNSICYKTITSQNFNLSIIGEINLNIDKQHRNKHNTQH